MKLTTKLFGLAGLVGAGIFARRARGRAGAGIADVDPVPLAQTAGEGIDVDAVEAAHQGAPAPRKNAP